MDEINENLPYIYSDTTTEFKCLILACGVDDGYSDKVFIENTKTKEKAWCNDTLIHIDWIGA